MATNPTDWTPQATNPTAWTPQTINPTRWNEENPEPVTGALLLSTGGKLLLSDDNFLGIKNP